MESAETWIQLYDDGLVARGELMWFLVDAMNDSDVAGFIANLPDRWPEEFVSWLRSQDWNLPSDSVVVIHGEGGEPLPESKIAAIRAWLSRHPGGAVPSEPD
jgi:hypothetical protein